MSNVSVLQAGLACCGVESSSVDLVSDAWEQTESVSKLSAAQHILVIAGTVTHALAPTVKSAYDALQEPKVVVAFGALFKIMEWPGATLIFNIGVVLEVIFGATILIYLLKNKNK